MLRQNIACGYADDIENPQSKSRTWIENVDSQPVLFRSGAISLAVQSSRVVQSSKSNNTGGFMWNRSCEILSMEVQNTLFT